MLDKKTIVSVVVPVYNGQRYLAKTLDTALAQSYQPLEVVVVDDGSTDDTPKIIAAYAARDRRVRPFRVKQGGVAAARNYGIGQARGQLVAMLDADDLWHPEKVARQVAIIKNSSDKVGLVYCWAIDIDEEDTVIPSERQVIPKQMYQGNVTQQLATSCFIETSSAPLIRRNYIQKIGGYDVDLKPQGAEDWKMYLALSGICEFAVAPEYLVGYRQYRASLSRDVSGMAGSIELVSGWVTDRWPNLPERVSRDRDYFMNCYLATKALSNNQFQKAIYYRAKAHQSSPERLLDAANIGFFLRLILRMIGVQPATFRPGGRLIPFEEFLAARAVKNSV